VLNRFDINCLHSGLNLEARYLYILRATIAHTWSKIVANNAAKLLRLQRNYISSAQAGHETRPITPGARFS